MTARTMMTTTATYGAATATPTRVITSTALMTMSMESGSTAITDTVMCMHRGSDKGHSKATGVRAASAMAASARASDAASK